MQIYKVGGAVRDRLLGREVTETDWVVVGASAEDLLAQGYRPVGADFPVFLHPQSGEEYALARTERKSGRGYGGFTFYASPEVTLEEDLIRRDLTVNAMAEDADGRIIDPYGGRDDLACACCATSRRPSPRIRCACCASPASPRATRRWAFASPRKPWR